MFFDESSASGFSFPFDLLDCKELQWLSPSFDLSLLIKEGIQVLKVD